MSFDSWVKNSWLERLQSDAPEIARLLALADGRLAESWGVEDTLGWFRQLGKYTN